MFSTGSMTHSVRYCIFCVRQVKSGSIFDNVLVTDDEKFAEDFGEKTWGASKDGEKKMKEDHDEEERKQREEEEKKRKDGQCACQVICEHKICLLCYQILFTPLTVLVLEDIAGCLKCVCGPDEAIVCPSVLSYLLGNVKDVTKIGTSWTV